MAEPKTPKLLNSLDKEKNNNKSIENNEKEVYEKPEHRIIVLQHQSHLLQASSGERNLRSVSGPFDYEGSDEDYKGDVR